MSLKQMLVDEAKSQIGEVGKMELGSEEYSKTIDGISKLVDKANDIDKIDFESSNQIIKQEAENEIKLEQMKHEKRDKFVKNCLTGISIAGGFALTVWGALNSWKFEEKGTVTSGPGREFMKKIFKG